MIKEKDIVIRVTKEFKDLIVKKAKEKGISTSSYIRMIILEKLNSNIDE